MEQQLCLCFVSDIVQILELSSDLHNPEPVWAIQSSYERATDCVSLETRVPLSGGPADRVLGFCQAPVPVGEAGGDKMYEDVPCPLTFVCDYLGSSLRLRGTMDGRIIVIRMDIFDDPEPLGFVREINVRPAETETETKIELSIRLLFPQFFNLTTRVEGTPGTGTCQNANTSMIKQGEQYLFHADSQYQWLFPTCKVRRDTYPTA